MPRNPKVVKLERIKQRVLRAYKKTINYAQKELYQEAWRMYDSFIDQFYSYPTVSYIRHGESRPGTKTGINLYRAQNIKLDISDAMNPQVIIDINSSDMEGGYQRHSPSEVLEYVLNGYRFVGYGNTMTWKGSYHGKYFSFNNLTMSRAFDEFRGYYFDMQTNIFVRNFKKFL